MLEGTSNRPEIVKGTLETNGGGKFTQVLGACTPQKDASDPERTVGMTAYNGVFSVLVAEGKLTMTATAGYTGRWQIAVEDGKCIHDGSFTAETPAGERIVEFALAEFRGQVVNVMLFPLLGFHEDAV